jgi:hypothetical protein
MDEPGAHAYLDLGPEDEEQLARLRRALILGDGFQINFLEVSHPRLAKEVLRRLRAWSGHDGVPPLAVVKTGQAAIRSRPCSTSRPVPCSLGSTNRSTPPVSDVSS